MIFTAETTEPESLGFQFDFYVNQEGVTPKHIGYCYLLPVDLKKSNDTKTVPITGLNHKPIGQIDRTAADTVQTKSPYIINSSIS